jgi:hypothetical protein
MRWSVFACPQALVALAPLLQPDRNARLHDIDGAEPRSDMAERLRAAALPLEAVRACASSASWCLLPSRLGCAGAAAAAPDCCARLCDIDSAGTGSDKHGTCAQWR